MNWKLLGGIGITGAFLYFFGSIIQAFFLIPTISGWLAPLGIGKHFAFALAIPIFFWLNLAMGKIFSLQKINRTIGLAMVLGVFGVISLFQGVQTNGDRFDRETGAPNYSFSNDGSGVKIRSGDTKYDPETGLKTVPLTPEALKGIEAAKREAWKKGGLSEMSDMYQSLSK
jgi:hypothetical protein